MCGIDMSHKIRGKPDRLPYYIPLTEFCDLGDIRSEESVNSKAKESDGFNFNYELFDHDIFCPYCGDHGDKNIIKRGERNTKRKGRVPRYSCKKCGHKFSKKKWGNQPLWVIRFILEEVLKGNTLEGIANDLGKEGYKITRQTILNIIKRCVNAFLKYEHTKKPKSKFREWQIDDTPQPFAKSTSFETPQQTQHRKRRHKYDKWWLTNIVDVDGYYWFACIASKEREAIASEQAVRTAVKRAHAVPRFWKCDGNSSHVKGIKNVLPHATIISVSKKEDFAVVNFIEGVIHSLLRSKAVKKRKKFRTLTTLQTFAELVRIWHNFLHRIDKLGGITPAVKVGIAPLFRDWNDLIDHVFQRI